MYFMSCFFPLLETCPEVEKEIMNNVSEITWVYMKDGRVTKHVGVIGNLSWNRNRMTNVLVKIERLTRKQQVDQTMLFRTTYHTPSSFYYEVPSRLLNIAEPMRIRIHIRGFRVQKTFVINLSFFIGCDIRNDFTRFFTSCISLSVIIFFAFTYSEWRQ